MSKITEYPNSTTIEDADLVLIVDDPGGVPTTEKRTWTNIKAFLKTYFDGLYLSSSTSPEISSGAGIPVSTPAKVGDIYIDTTNDDAYIAVGSASSADWEKSNDGVGGAGVTNGNKGDITVSGDGDTWDINDDAVEITHLSATGTPSASTYLRGDNTWGTPSGAGDVTKVGTPANNQVAVWTGDGTIEGDANLTWDGTALTATDVIVTDEAYGVGWNGNNEVPTKNALYDKIESISVVGGLTISEVTGTSQAGAVNNWYIINNAALCTVTLPDTAALGSIIKLTNKGAGGWKIAQNASESIRIAGAVTTTGTSGYLQSTGVDDCIELICITANTTWKVQSMVGNITYV